MHYLLFELKSNLIT